MDNTEEMDKAATARILSVCGEGATLAGIMSAAQIMDTDNNARRVARLLRASGWRKCRSREHGYIWKRRTDSAHDAHGFECPPPAAS